MTSTNHKEAAFVTRNPPNKLVLGWMPEMPMRDLKSRSRKGIGTLSVSDHGYEFSYLPSLVDDEDLRAAEYPAFPYREKPYSNCMGVFARRLPDVDRPDYANFLERHGLNPCASYSIYHTLAVSGGRLMSDSYELVDPLEDILTGERILIDIAGVRHFQKAWIDFDEDSQLMLESIDSQHDDNAVGVMSADGVQMGWVNRLQASGIRSYLRTGSFKARLFRRNGRPDYPKAYALLEAC